MRRSLSALSAVGSLALASTGPLTATAQANPHDSVAIASAIAAAIQPRIPTTGANHGAKMDQRPSSQFAAAAWTRLVGHALAALDTNLVAPTPTTYTTSINIVSVLIAQDSLVARVAFTQCHDTARGPMFGGTSYDYVFRRADTKWGLARNEMRGNGDGRCK